MEQVFADYLTSLNIPVSRSYFRKRVASHPDYPSLLSISDALEQLGIPYEVVRIDKTELESLTFPYVLHLNKSAGEFVVIEGETDLKEKPDLLHDWDGVVLKAEAPEAMAGGFYERQRQILEQEMAYTQQLLEKLHQQKQIQQRDFELAEEEYEMQKQLAENDHIAPVELARAESKLSARRLPLQQTESAIINNHVSQTAKEKEIMELEKRMAEQRSVFLQAVNIMKSAIDEWKQTHLLIAPYEGEVVYAGVIQENQTLATGQDVFYIQPENTQYFGEMTVSQQSFGKIVEGQQVQVRFSGYPYHEYGSVFGQVDYFSEFPVRDSLFFSQSEFPGRDGDQLRPGDSPPHRDDRSGGDHYAGYELLQRVLYNMTKELR